jgi:hypothetical protein
MTDRISLLLSLNPSKLMETLPTMNIQEIEELSHQTMRMIRMITAHHHHCRRHRIRIPEQMRHLEKSWDQTLPIMKELLLERNGTTPVKLDPCHQEVLTSTSKPVTVNTNPINKTSQPQPLNL